MRACLAVLILGLAALPAAAQQPLPDAGYRKLNAALVDSHILPRTQALAAATQALAGALDTACATPGAGPDAARPAFLAAMDAWQDVAHVRFGPVEKDDRLFRFSFWPDPRNTAGRQIGDLLRMAATEPLPATVFAEGRAAAQGFPALERVLYEEAGGPAARCRVAQAMGRNLAAMSRAVDGEWRQGTPPFRAVIEDAGAPGSPFPDARWATLEFMKAINAAIEPTEERKLLAPLGSGAADARPRATESWRSGHSLENIRHNVDAAAHLYRGGDGYGFDDFLRGPGGAAAAEAKIAAAFARAQAAAGALAVPLEDAVASEAIRPAVFQLFIALQDLRSTLIQTLPEALHLPVGFNSMDGD